MDLKYLSDKLKDIPDFGGAFLYDNFPTILKRKLYVILYITSYETDHVGHFCVIDNRNIPKGWNHSTDLFYFDPFGNKPDFVRLLYKKFWNAAEPNNRISSILSSYNYSYNRHDFQDQTFDDCGNWCIFYSRHPNMRSAPWTQLLRLPNPIDDLLISHYI